MIIHTLYKQETSAKDAGRYQCRNQLSCKGRILGAAMQGIQAKCDREGQPAIKDLALSYLSIWR